jgi:hypothetical protein
MECNNEKLVELKVVGLMHKTMEKESNSIILENLRGDRRLQIVIGPTEAQSIACVMRGIRPPRPLTHDLMADILDRFHVRLDAVVINMLPDGIFSGSLLLYDEHDPDSNHVVDARSSDAIAMALRAGAKIFISPKLFREIGVRVNLYVSPNCNTFPGEIPPDIQDEPTIEELEEQLHEAIETEKYEEAARLKAEIERRRNEPDKDKFLPDL